MFDDQYAKYFLQDHSDPDISHLCTFTDQLLEKNGWQTILYKLLIDDSAFNMVA